MGFTGQAFSIIICLCSWALLVGAAIYHLAILLEQIVEHVVCVTSAHSLQGIALGINQKMTRYRNNLSLVD